ncbi:MAG: hypothetical protein OXG74_19720 [Acidobacteria bacterium]|nr:hypothetical protein [Acidobacteriota bacterium]
MGSSADPWRTATRELHEFVDVVRAAQQPIQALRKAVTWLGILGPLIILALGFVGGLAAGLLLRQPPT